MYLKMNHFPVQLDNWLDGGDSDGGDGGDDDDDGNEDDRCDNEWRRCGLNCSLV